MREEVQKVIVGQRELIDRLLIALLTEGHLLLEGVPGLAKTLTVETLSAALNLSFQRIQFTPDLLPADIVGTMIYNPQEQSFSAKKGPVFSQILLADEINRAPPKVQAALLEAMSEKQVTLGEKSHPLPTPFLVLATQNPIEQEGTYPLPEAQLDRFMMKVVLSYPVREEEREILSRMVVRSKMPKVQPVFSPEQLSEVKKILEEIYIDEKILDYVLNLVEATRDPQKYGLNLEELIEYGVSPRATLALVHAAKAHALLSDRGFVTPHDIKSIAPNILCHRLSLSYEAQAEELSTGQIVKRILDALPVP